MSGQHCENYDVKRETVHCYPGNVDRCCTWSEVAWCCRWNLSAFFKNCFCFVLQYQGRGRRLLKFSYMHHPTKNDVTSGLNWASQLASQSEKMAFRLFKISLCLWTICFVSVYNEDGKIFQAHTFDFLSKNFWKREQFSIVLKENNGDPSVIEWRILHICKTDVAQTFGSCRSWFSDYATCNSL